MKVVAILVVLALCASALAQPGAAPAAAQAPNSPLSAIAGAAKNVAGAIGNAVGNAANAVVNGAKSLLKAPEAAALAAANNNLVGAINCAIKASSGKGAEPQKPKLPQAPKLVAPVAPNAVPPKLPPIAAAGAGGVGTFFLEESDPALAATAAPPTGNLVAPVAPGVSAAPEANAAPPAAQDGNGAAVPAAPTSSALAAYMSAQLGVLSGGGAPVAVTSENIATLCSGGAGGAQKGKKSQAQAQKQKAKALATGPAAAPAVAPKLPPVAAANAGGYGTLLQLRARFRRDPGVGAVKAQAPKPAQGAKPAQKPLAKEGGAKDDAMAGAMKAACVLLSKLGAGILNTCPAAATDNSDVDLAPLLAALGGNGDDPNGAPAGGAPGPNDKPLKFNDAIVPGVAPTAPPATMPAF